ncbi:MAG: TOBE domain-containing protein [Haloarculaceae archaeon]
MALAGKYRWRERLTGRRDGQFRCRLTVLVAVMRDGTAEQVATPRELYHRPTSRFVAEFVGDNNLFDGRAQAVAEEVSVSAPKRWSSDGDSNRLGATVESAEFLGETTRVTLDWAGQKLLLRTRDPLDGDVTVGFDPADAHVVERHSR